MIKTILAPAIGTDADPATFAAALAVARPCLAHLEMLHVRMNAAEVAVTMSAEGATATLVSGLIERLEAESDQRERKAKAAFDDFCRREGLALARTPPDNPSAPTAEWLTRTGSEPYWVANYGRAADLLVLGRNVEGDGFALDTIETALIDSGRPLLIPGTAPLTALPETVAIAWKPTREAARAVHAAMPILALAKRITILTVAEDESTSDKAVAARLLGNLRWHGFAVSARQVPPGDEGPAGTLLAAAEAEKALLLMGGYGHGRLREWIFGGFTRHALETASLPILIAH